MGRAFRGWQLKVHMAECTLVSGPLERGRQVGREPGGYKRRVGNRVASMLGPPCLGLRA